MIITLPQILRIFLLRKSYSIGYKTILFWLWGKGLAVLIFKRVSDVAVAI